MKTTIGISLAVLLFTTGCKNQENQQPQAQQDSVSVEVQGEEAHHHDHNEAIELDNGKKWKVDAPMLSLIRNMESTINAYNEAQKVVVLTDSLQSDIDRLTSNCTMKGKAHDELHKWLLPYIDLVDAVKSKPTADALKELKASFATFNTYFE